MHHNVKATSKTTAMTVKRKIKHENKICANIYSAVVSQQSVK